MRAPWSAKVSLGPVRLVQVEYIQSGLATRVEDGPQNNRFRWILDPQRSGLALVLSAIGCHAQHLACFASDLAVARVVADVGALLPGRKVVDYVSALVGFEGGARGTFTVTQAAAGGENDIRLRIYGEKGMLDWSHREPSYLRVALQGEPVKIFGRGDAFLPPDIIAAGRTPRGHPEGLREAFANIYAEMAQERMARELGEPSPRLSLSADRGRRAHDGVHRGLRGVAGTGEVDRRGAAARLSSRLVRFSAPPPCDDRTARRPRRTPACRPPRARPRRTAFRRRSSASAPSLR